jgi:putative phage-type endonuclease
METTNNICHSDIEEFVKNNISDGRFYIISELYNIYNIQELSPEKYVVDMVVNYEYEKVLHLQNVYDKRKTILNQLKLLELPEQRSKEWYEMRRDKLTASSLAAAIGKCHFTSREELILNKIEEQPYESNPITEWGVKYEDIAIAFYEEMYNVKVLDFGMVPHPTFEAFGASPDGICDDTGNDEYVGRMVEIKCPPKRKFTKTVPPHYGMQVQGQLEVCDLDECDFFQVKIEDYENFEEYSKDVFINDDIIVPGRTNLNYPKGCTLTYIKSNENKMSYLYPKLNLTDEEYKNWIKENKEKVEKEGHKFVESKWWFILRYECTLVLRDKVWWINNIEHILKFYNDLNFYRIPENLNILKEKVGALKKRKRKTPIVELEQFLLVSSEEEDN